MGDFAALAETHSAVVFFAGDYAYKLKKPVSLGFLDFSTPAARAQACQRETELNRRFAPDVYRGVAEVRDPDGAVCDYLVVMRRMPAARRLATLVQAGAPVAAPVHQVARMLAAQHAASPRRSQISAEGTASAVSRRWEENLAGLAQVRGDLVDATEIDDVATLAERFLRGRSQLFDQRIGSGRIVDGHGDLLAGDIFCLDDGPRILDCLEFSDQLRWLDGLDDAAMLAMDLERLGARTLAEQFTGWYAEFAGDPAPASLLHHYVAYRAMVRAKVGCLRAAQGNAEAAGEARGAAALGVQHLRAGAVTLVLLGGLPGTGKSVLADAIADKLGFTVLSSDRIRKELAGKPAEEPAGAPYETGIYSASWTDRTYAELLRRAVRLLSAGESVIADASWISAQQRLAAITSASQAAADLVQLECVAPAPVTARRVAERRAGASDANATVAARMAADHSPWPEATVIDTSEPAAAGGTSPAALAHALGIIRPHGPEHVWRPARPYMQPD